MDLGDESSSRFFTNRSWSTVWPRVDENATRVPSGEKTGKLFTPSNVSCLGVVPSATL